MFVVLSVQCDKKEDKMAPDNWLEHNYAGTLVVRYVSEYPEWDVSTTMDVVIDKELGAVTISQGTLSYSGETIIDEDGKIIRSGSWSLYPTGYLTNPDDPYVYIDGGVVIENDEQKIYAKDNSGVWHLVSTVKYDAVPNADLAFNLDDAVLDGATIQAGGPPSFTSWTLYLTVGLD